METPAGKAAARQHYLHSCSHYTVTDDQLVRAMQKTETKAKCSKSSNIKDIMKPRNLDKVIHSR